MIISTTWALMHFYKKFHTLVMKAQNIAKENEPCSHSAHFPRLFFFAPKGYKNPSWSIFFLVSFQLETRCQICSTRTIRSDLEWALCWWFGPTFHPGFFFFTAGQRERFLKCRYREASHHLSSSQPERVTHVESIYADCVNLNGLMMVFMLEGHKGFDGLPRRLTSEPPGIYQAGFL